MGCNSSTEKEAVNTEAVNPTACIFCKEDCKTVEKAGAHQKKCAKRIVACTECKKEVAKDEMKAHVADGCNTQKCEFCEKAVKASVFEAHKTDKCVARPVKAPCCGTEMKFKEMPTHMAACTDVMEDCDFCGADIKRSEIDAHEKECKADAEQKEADRLAALEAKRAAGDASPEELALEALKGMTTSIGLVAADCPEKGIRVISLRNGAGSVYSYVCAGDLILSMDAKEILSIEDLKGILANHYPGDLVDLEIKRGSDKRTETIKLELWAQGATTLKDIRELRAAAKLETSERPILNEAEALEQIQTLKKRVGFTIVDGPEDGIRVKKVAKGGPAYIAGIRNWDIITSVGEEHVTTSKEFGALLKNFLPGELVPVELERNGYDKRSTRLEIGARQKENTIEKIRCLRTIAGLETASNDVHSDDSSTDDCSADDDSSSEAN